MGSPILGRVALFCALDRNEGFLHSSILSCFAMGSPGGSSVWFPSLDRNEAVFGLAVWFFSLQDGVTLPGLDL